MNTLLKMLKLIIKEKEYLFSDRALLKSTKKIYRLFFLQKAMLFWRRELEIERNVSIDAELGLPKFLNFLKHPWRTKLLHSGGYMNSICTKKYQIVLNKKSANEGGLVHELVHIKLKHDERLKKIDVH